jgi:hypothetical protein
MERASATLGWSSPAMMLVTPSWCSDRDNGAGAQIVVGLDV